MYKILKIKANGHNKKSINHQKTEFKLKEMQLFNNYFISPILGGDLDLPRDI